MTKPFGAVIVRFLLVTFMPFQSKRQQRWAFANKKPFARRWAKQTDFGALPEHKDAGPPLAGPGGLLGAPGLGTTRPRRWGNRRKDAGCTCGVNVATKEQIAPGITRIRGNLCNVHGRYGPCDASASKKPPKSGKGGKGRKPKAPPKPKVTPEQRAQERAAQQAENRAAVLTQLGIAADGQEALAALRRGEQPDPAAIARMGGVAAGLIEQAADGSYRLSASGRAMLAAADAGDAGRAGDTISSARDRTSARTQRQEAAAQRKRDAEAKRAAAAAEAAKKKPAKGGGGSGSSRSSGGRASDMGDGFDQADTVSAASGHVAHDDNRAAMLNERRRRAEERRSRGIVRPDARTDRVDPYRMQVDAPGRRERKRKRKPAHQATPGPAATPTASAEQPIAGSGPRGRWRTTRKAQSDQEKAMFAKMGGSGGGGKGSGGSTLWKKGPSGKRTPQAGVESKARPPDPGKPARGQTSGNLTKAYGADPTTSYTMRHELVDMADIQASNTVGGGINPKYDPALQPRDRSRASSQAQIAEVAQKMNPDVLTTDFHRIDAGTPIVDAHGNVLSGNGRTLALQRAAELHPDKYADYKASIKAQARDAGIDPAMVDKMQNPVLVRRLTGDADAAAFAREANSSGTLRMSPLEQAKVDAGSISHGHMLKMHVSEGQDIDKSLRDKANKPFVDEFLKTVPANERANLLTRNGELNQMGLYRIKAAVYTRAFPGEHGERMAESMLESLDPDVKQIQNGISGGLPALSRAQALIRSGQREHNLDISEDLAKTIDVYARLKDNPSLTANTPAHMLVKKYLGQTSMFGRELTDEQERLLIHIDGMSRSPTRVRSFLERYARMVENEPQPGQASLFGGTMNLTRQQLFDALLADEGTTKAATKAMRTDLPPLPPVRKRADYSDIKATDLVMALFHDRIAPPTAMREKSFLVYKDASGQPRWLARTTTAYRDRDREILAIAALDADSQRMTATQQYGPLRWWHVGEPDPFDARAPWGAGLDIGDCDYSAQIGTTRVESGTFRSPQLAARIAATADEYELSPGFFHPADQPGADGVYTTIKTFERSLVPTRYGRASNLYTGMTVKEQHMDEQEQARRFKAMVDQLGLSPEQASAMAAGLTHTDKSAAAQGVAYKSEPVYTPESDTVVYSAPDGTQGLIVNGQFVALKAAMAAEVKAPMPPDEMIEAGDTEAADGEADEEAEYIGDMEPGAFRALLVDAFQEAIQSFGSGVATKLAEFDEQVKGMGYARTKAEAASAATVQRIAQLETELATLKGEQPKVIEHEAAAALKSTGPAAPPDPNALPTPENAIQAAAMRTFPDLYRTNANGQWAGWQPQQVPPSQS